MPEIKQISRITSTPGCRRDGTTIDGDYYSAVQHTRFQRGRPKKMGGFQLTTHLIPGPVSKMLIWSKQQIMNAFTFNPKGCSLTVMDSNGDSGTTSDLTPEDLVSTIQTVTAAAYVGCAFDGTVYVSLISGTNKCVTSPDGVAWTEHATMPVSTFWTHIVWDGINLVAIATGGTASAYSSDHGLTWTATVLPSSGTWRILASGGGKILAFKNNTSTFAYSTDHGLTWTAGTFPASSLYPKYIPAWNGSVWSATTSGAATFTSSDGITWTLHTSQSPSSANVVVFNGLFYTVRVGTIASSSDGISWSMVSPFYTSTHTAPYLVFDQIYVASYGLILLSSANGDATSTNRYGFSSDGINWTQGELAAIAHWDFANFSQATGVILSTTTMALTTRRSQWATNSDYIWSADTLYDSAANSQGSVVLAAPTKTAIYIDDQTESPVYWALADGSTPFVDVTDVNGVASGGVFCTAPYAILYGTDGKVTWSNANEPQNYTTGDAGTARVTSRKIVYGAPLRTGGGPGGLLWSLDSVIKMQYVGGQAIFNFQTLSTNSTVLSQNGIVEYDGNHFWPGVDRFMVCNGSTVQEVPNQLNLNWFFDNLNFSARQKVWGTKVPRYGEIWWFYPRGDATECTHAVIFNMKENAWYDTELPRSAGVAPSVFEHPLWISSDNTYLKITYKVLAGISSDPLPPGNPCAGEISGFRGRVVSSEGEFGAGAIAEVTIRLDNGIIPLIGENFIALDSGLINMDIDGAIVNYQVLDGIYVHEKGYDRVEDGYSYAIESYFETSDFGLPSGGYQPGSDQGLNRWTRIVRIEPDFIQEGNMQVNILSKEFPASADVTSMPYVFTPTTERIDMREQGRLYRLKFISNTSGGHFEMGRVMVHTEPGDVRN